MPFMQKLMFYSRPFVILIWEAVNLTLPNLSGVNFVFYIWWADVEKVNDNFDPKSFCVIAWEIRNQRNSIFREVAGGVVVVVAGGA